MTSAHRENLLTLAHALGVDGRHAATLLAARVAVTAGPRPCDRFCSDLTIALLKRTFADVGVHVPDPNLEIVVGDAKRRTAAPAAIFVHLSGTRAVIDHEPSGQQVFQDVPRPVSLLAGCYAAAAATRSIVGPAIAPARYPLVIDLADLLDHDLAILSGRLEFGEAYLAGAGAIGNAFLLGLSTLDVSGTIHIADHDSVSPGNLNRCFFFSDADIGLAKATVLATRAALPLVRLVPHVARLQAVPGANHIEQLIVGVDSPRARRHLQDQLPRNVFDASTTGIAEVVLHFNDVTRREYACLSCVYHAQPLEDAHERHVAEALGVTLEDVRSQYVDARAAEKIRERYTQLTEIDGLAYDTLFKQLCGQRLLTSSEGAQVLAPFGFVSVLAGALLAIEFARRTLRQDAVHPFNYWRVSPWTAPVMALRQTNPPHPRCTFCSEPVLVGVATKLWGEP
jgi:ThiF family protein/E1 ligase-like protein